MWNFWPFGGYLAYRLSPDQPVFVDGRNALARGSDLVRLARASESDEAAFDEVVRRFDVTWAITAAAEDMTVGVPLARSPQWRMVHLDDVAAVYVRTTGADAALAEDPYRILTHLTPVAAALDLATMGDARAAAVDHDGALAAHDDPSSPRAAALDACGAVAAHDAHRFGQAIARIELLAPGHPASAILREAWRASTGR
jgi:hypothetical protein